VRTSGGQHVDGDVVDGTSSLMFERVITGAGRRVMPHLFAPLTMGRPGLIDGRDPSWPKKVGLIPPTPKRRVVV
jgi:hypothetical protein